MGRPKHPHGDALPVRFALIDDKGRFRSLHANVGDALRAYTKFRFDSKTPGDTDAFLHAHEAGWSVVGLSKPLVPVHDARDRLWGWTGDDVKDIESFDIWLR